MLNGKIKGLDEGKIINSQAADASVGVCRFHMQTMGYVSQNLNEQSI